MKVRDGVAMIGLCSGVPRAPFIASGRLGHVQRAGCERLLTEAGRLGLTRIVMIHHPPRISDPGGHIGRGLSDHLAFAQIIGRVGAELVIHGHNHKLYVDHIQGPEKPVPVVGVPSASAVKGKLRNRAGYHLFSIDGVGKHREDRGTRQGPAAGRQPDRRPRRPCVVGARRSLRECS